MGANQMGANQMGKKPKIAAIILAAGQGLRLGGDRPKQYQLLGHEPLLRRTVRVFTTYHQIHRVLVVTPVGGREEAAQALGSLADEVVLVEGGATRQLSAWLGLCALQEFSPDYVHIHDAARPFVTHQLLDNITAALTPDVGIVPTLAVTDTLKKGNSAGKKGNIAGEIIATIDRQGLYAAQTPQSFPYASILSAHERARREDCQHLTDDASVGEYDGLRIQMIEGDVDNIKITTRADMDRAMQMLTKERPFFPDLRTGNGYDVHMLEKGDGIILCGVKIAHPYKLSGHSDADVALHALTDALLATMGAGDIGTHFPPSQPQWRGAPSHIFVTHALQLIRARAGRIVNIDITLIAEAPKIAPHRDAMVMRLASLLGLEETRISVKATTNERLGFIGREEGIAAIATANVLYPGEVPENKST